MDLATLAVVVTATSGAILGAAAFIAQRRDRAHDVAERAAEAERHEHHEDRAVAVSEIETAIKWQTETIRDLRKQLAEEREHCDEQVTYLRGQVAVLQARVAELERSRS